MQPNMPSQDPALGSFGDDIRESGHEEPLDNEKRGCGHLKHNAAYVRSDVQALSSPEGEIPRFVELDQPVEYREYSGRGAILPGWGPFPGAEFGLAYRNEGFTTTPAGAIEEHHERLEHLEFDGDHYGEITVARSHDLLMSVGETHWQTPGSYIEECREMGLNLKIPSGPNNEPPVVNPFVTRCWVVHPNGVEDGRAGIIGYAVLTRTVFTTGEDATADDADIPKYAQEWAETGKVDLATPGEEVDPEEEQPDAEIDDFAAKGDGGATVVPSDKEGRDVEEAEGSVDGTVPMPNSNAPEGTRLREMDDDEIAEVEDTLSTEDSDVEIEDDVGDFEDYDPDEDDDLPDFEDATFWEQYDIPFDFATAQNNRLGELQRDSTGTGETESTVTHLYVLESFEDGRLSREADRFLCRGEGDRPDRPSGPAENPAKVTCSECQSLMERWEIEEDE